MMTTMGANFVSTHYLANSLVQPVMRAQSQLTTAMTELSTGQYADLGLQLGDQSGYELSLKEQVQQLQALTTGNSVVASTMSTAQNALTSIATSAQTTMQNLAGWTPGSIGAGSQLQLSGQTALQDLISSANATSGDVYVFGRINSSGPPMADYYSPASAAKTAVDQAFQTEFGCLPTDAAAANITAAKMQSFLIGPFATLFSGTNWTTDWSSASSTNTTAEIAQGQTVTTSTSTTPTASTATDPNPAPTAFQRLAEAYTMLAEFGGSQLSSAAQQAVVTTAQPLILQGQTSLTNTQAALGATQSQVTDANNAMSSQLTILQDQLGNFDNVNATTTAAQITRLTNQIQMAYELTSRLSQLNLAQYLPA
jgi:flagellar hook-associated protein 3 FlgL